MRSHRRKVSPEFESKLVADFARRGLSAERAAYEAARAGWDASPATLGRRLRAVRGPVRPSAAPWVATRPSPNLGAASAIDDADDADDAEEDPERAPLVAALGEAEDWRARAAAALALARYDGPDFARSLDRGEDLAAAVYVHEVGLDALARPEDWAQLASIVTSSPLMAESEAERLEMEAEACDEAAALLSAAVDLLRIDAERYRAEAAEVSP